MEAIGYSCDEVEEISDMEASVGAVENLLGYRFKQKKLLEEALTHSSCAESTSYQRLEFIGDAALGLAISNFVYLSYPGLDQGKLTLLRAANICTEKLARVAVRHRLYKYVRRNVAALDDKVREFVMAVQEEEELEIHGGLVKAPKVLADIVESVAAALYVDCNFDLHTTWEIFRNLLEPIVTLDILEQQPQPVTMLFESCQKDGKQVEISYGRKEEKFFATVTIDGKFLASAFSEQKENAKLLVAKAALRKLSFGSCDPLNDNIFNHLNRDGEIEGAKQKLHELCGKKKWPKPNYKIQKEVGSAHQKRYTCSVEIEISKGILFVEGNEKPRVREAESSAASIMLYALKDANYL
ncbi:ribonuclease 3-like protein 2 isoform X2 [Salvia miltiorrhiza]|nr:ribonuclease 3-like protein 2 isoform X2 [Salvia miltiorrhiza]XP_057765607.1 ribonuclease 3-like protein 2 isoform X2 [Salvia miltiorrhiza]XP_057765608.1 ribonuclease 3-like protein 2 isoform X2 [Salvia miltiorrhiza]XP_057765609.1 ribonuclease 3-like protein 2 isoform X2 [Salvia miltiorrhiza]